MSSRAARSTQSGRPERERTAARSNRRLRQISFWAGRIADTTARESRAAFVSRVQHRGVHARYGVEPTEFDPLDTDVVADPYPSYRALLSGGPVHYSAKRDIWIISRYDDARAASRAHEELSSAESITRLRARFPMLLTIDPPDHSRLRRLVARDFAREPLERRRPEIERLASDAVVGMLARGESEAVSQLASPLPVAVIADLLGVPAADRRDLRRWSGRAMDGFALEIDLSMASSLPRAIRAVEKLHSYFLDQFERRRRRPGNDLLSRLLVSSEEGQLSDDELFWFAFLLLAAGIETTTNLLGTMLLSFAQHPEQYARVREDPDLCRSAVEESLRYVSPIQGYYRTALRNYQVGRAIIPAGARVLVLWAAANRDPRRYSQADRFLVDRNPTDHLAFGSGIHFCLGAHLARLEGELVLRELVARVRAIDLAGEVAWSENPSLRGLSRLPVRLQPARVDPRRRTAGSR